ncbi:hypothetical protein WJX75_009327 [Coccomyxa subellipsoidea]|uniref:Nop domain-containing protein n=1 Tax=Coccomyxa subellipsoidea TaxID=248742 RepID=A0ABR2YRL5_9CHLO
MLLLFETAAGFALFKVLQENKIQETEDLWQDFETLDGAQKVVKLKAFSKFEDTIEALAAATAIGDSKLSKDLKKFLKKNADGKTLGVADAKLGSLIKEKLGIPCIYSNGVQELTRGVRSQIEGLISGLAGGQDLTPMSLGLSHSLSRYKLKFSPDKVDTMIVQAIGLLDDLDKELNTYAMRVREWYGWHFPEMTKIVTDNIVYAKVIKLMGTRENAVDKDFSGIPLEEEVEEELKETAIISMGTEISEIDLVNIMSLCDQVIALAEYRAQLYEYLKSRMMAIAPNLTVLVGELVGARLIAHAGSLVNLAKAPASTVQILGAEKALFRALKTKHETPKYGLIFHASLIGQAAPKYKGKISRVLAAKCALSIRVDALGDVADAHVGLEARAKVEARLRQLEGKLMASDSAKPRAGKGDIPKYDAARQSEAGPALITAAKAYNPDADVTADAGKEEKKRKKKKAAAAEEATAEPNGVAEAGPSEAAPAATNGKPEAGEKKKKKKKRSAEEAVAAIADAAETAEPVKKKKKKEAAEVNGVAAPTSEKKKKKKAKVESV